ncbi:MAG: hypothetical protein DWP98_02870 [Bacteroidetes bacterium]|nr:MAG: hypothetical protein DWP98_02870 [Bacteroidota bacterium]MBL1144295.1 GWxTD domain-containing protein [Bacteroidota bacterium]NOG57092.1 GWxTD domain-containing protein [Bacteroidota bacterium]
MKKPLILLLLLSSLYSVSWAQSQAKINLSIDYKFFNLPDDSPYIEVYLTIHGNSLKYLLNENKKLQASAELTYMIYQKDSIIAFNKFKIISPEYAENEIVNDIIDLKRIPLKNGIYEFEFIARDLADSLSIENRVELEPLNFSKTNMEFSEIQFANSIKTSEENSPFSKSGLEILPNIGNFYPKNLNVVGFYAELYNSNIVMEENEVFLIDYSISPNNSDEVINNLRSYQRATASSVIPIAQTFDIEQLPSGNYSLKISCKNKLNETLLVKEAIFQRSNPNLENLSLVNVDNSFAAQITNIALLKEYINSTTPIASAAEIEFAKNQMEYSQLEFMQKYFLNFWKERDKSDPEQAWLNYKREVEIADKEFGYGGIKGYQTERGRVYLQYGKPNAVQNMTYEPNTYPYSVWQYYKLKGYTNRRFIFYSPTMETLGYQLLHSNMPGEIQNRNWQAELENKKTNRGKTYEMQQDEVINERAKDLFDNPR